MFESAEVTRRGGPRVLEAGGELPRRRGAPSKVKRQQDLSTRRMRQGVDDTIEHLELRQRRKGRRGVRRPGLGSGLPRLQSSSTSQITSSSSTGPIGSHTAITSGVWCARSDACPSFH